jgi:HSP20 family protein
MFSRNRWSPFDEVFTFHREVDRLLNQFWRDLPARSFQQPSPQLQAKASDDGWRIEIPIPGMDPRHVTLEAAGSTLTVRAERPGDAQGNPEPMRYEQTLAIPEFLDLGQVKASHRFGVLELTLPLKDSVRPRRVQIDIVPEDAKQLATA